VKAPAWLASSNDATPALLAAYEERFGRPFPPGLLPGEPLYPVGGGPLAWLTASRDTAWSDVPRRRSVDLLFGSAVARGGKALIAFTRVDFRRRAPLGYFVAGFAARPLGDLRFYYMRRDAWSRVMFRFACEGQVSRERGATIPRFLERFELFARSARACVTSLVAFEKDGLAGSYEIAIGGREFVHDRSRFDDCAFGTMLG